MHISSIFNETELAIFCKQNHFTFSDYLQCPDGTIFSIDHSSVKVFIGTELLRKNVHSLFDITSAVENDGVVSVTFIDSRTVSFDAGNDSAAIVAELQDYADEEDDSDNEQQEFLDAVQTDKALRETYARLINTGRSKAIGYLVSDVGMNVKDANKYLDQLETMETAGETSTLPKISSPGIMSGEEIFSVVKKLKSGDRIHLEYKPFIGKKRVYDAVFTDLVINIDSHNDSVYVRESDYSSLMEDLKEKMFNYMSLWFLCPGKESEIDIRLDKLRVLRKL